MASSIKGINVTIGADTRGLDKALADVNRRARETGSELKTVDRLLKLDPKNTVLVAQKQKLLQQAVGATRDKLKSLKDAQAQVEAQFKRGEIGEESYRAFQREIIRTEAELKRLEAVGKRTAEQMAASLKTAGAKMKSAGKTMTAGVTLPLLAIAGVGGKVAADFDVVMAQLAVATKTPKKELDGLRELAIRLGADTAFSAGEAAEAMLALAKAGINPAQIQAGALKSTLDLAAASGMDLAEAATVMSSGMNTFSLGAGDAAKIVDALAGAANASNADVSDLAQALQQVGAQASTSGQPIEKVTAVLAALADAGIRGSDAGTSLKTFLQRLVPASSEAAEAMDAVGLSFFDAKGNMLPLEQIAGRLKTAFGGLTQEQRLSRMQAIFGSDAMRAATVLYNQGAGGIAKYVRATSESGAASEMAKARMSGLAGATEALRGSLETAALRIGETLAPVLMKIAKFVTELVNRFVELPAPVQKLLVVLGGVAAAAGPVLVVIGHLVSAIGAISGAIASAGGVGAAIAGIATPIGWVVGIAVALAAVALVVWRNWDKLKGAFLGVWKTVQPFFDWAVSTIKGALAPALEDLKKAWADIAPVVEEIMPVLKTVGMVLGGTILVGIGLVIGAVTLLLVAFAKLVQGAAWLAKTLTGAFKGAWESGAANLGRMVEFFKVTLPNAIGSAVAWLASLPAKAGAALAKLPYIMGVLVGRSIAFIAKLPGRAASAVSSMASAVAKGFTRAKTWATAQASALLSRVVAFFVQLPGRAASAISALPAKVADLVTRTKDKAVAVASQIVSGIRNAMSGAYDAFTGSIGRAIDWIKGLPGRLYDMALEIGKKFVAGLLSGLQAGSPTLPERTFADIAAAAEDMARRTSAGVRQLGLKTELAMSFGGHPRSAAGAPALAGGGSTTINIQNLSLPSVKNGQDFVADLKGLAHELAIAR